MDELRKTYRDWVQEFLAKQGRERQPRWTESIAIGAEAFVRETKEKLGIRVMGREVKRAGESYELREPEISYEANFGHENDDLRQENTYFWDVSL
jgi:hypothetical protein